MWIFWNERMSHMLNIHVTYNETKKLTSCQKGIRFLEFRDRFQKRLLCYRREDHIQGIRWSDQWLCRYPEIRYALRWHKTYFHPPPLKKKRKIFRKHRWIVTFSWKLWNSLFKRRKTAELYIEILIVQTNFFPWFFALSSFFGVQFNKKRNLWNWEQFAHNFSNYLCATNFLQMLALFKEGFWNFLAS